MQAKAEDPSGREGAEAVSGAHPSVTCQSLAAFGANMTRQADPKA